ncbi:unnamed protein product [Zymoseptoria tritici ST99CH_1E4]|uniref:Ribosome biogenesis protein SLX9 n=1 Tax=Zymoseptoria tritici ST99CH_1E4 TaxID=1276532 RepID=A0A2H1FKY9_ZYMTR|nr:unnamed protein product [Zymoseptoria tritici ST99CH_1E4]
MPKPTKRKALVKKQPTKAVAVKVEKPAKRKRQDEDEVIGVNTKSKQSKTRKINRNARKVAPLPLPKGPRSSNVTTPDRMMRDAYAEEDAMTAMAGNQRRGAAVFNAMASGSGEFEPE